MVAARDGGSKIAIQHAPQIRRGFSSGSVDAVALNAGEGFEQALPLGRIGREAGSLRRERGREEDKHDPPHRVNLTPVVTRCVRNPS